MIFYGNCRLASIFHAAIRYSELAGCSPPTQVILLLWGTMTNKLLHPICALVYCLCGQQVCVLISLSYMWLLSFQCGLLKNTRVKNWCFALCVCVCAHSRAHTHMHIVSPHVSYKWEIKMMWYHVWFWLLLISKFVESIDQVTAELWKLNSPQNIVLCYKPYMEFC
jgi:hypothetical protein